MVGHSLSRDFSSKPLERQHCNDRTSFWNAFGPLPSWSDVCRPGAQSRLFRVRTCLCTCYSWLWLCRKLRPAAYFGGEVGAFNPVWKFPCTLSLCCLFWRGRWRNSIQLEKSYARCTFSLKIARKGILVAERFLHILERHEILPHVSYFKKFRATIDQ